MTPAGIDRQRERRWRHLANWLWLAPVVWWILGGAYYGLTKDLATVLSLIFVPWWVLLAGFLGYLLLLIHARWGKTPVIVTLVVAALAGASAWSVAGIHAALSCGIVAPLILSGGLLRIPPSPVNSTSRTVLATFLGMSEPFLVLASILSLVLLILDGMGHGFPAAWIWWVVALVSAAILAWSFWLRRSWSRAAKNASAM